MEAVMRLSSSTLQYSSLTASTGHIIQVNGYSGRALAKARSTNGYSICVCTENYDIRGLKLCYGVGMYVPGDIDKTILYSGKLSREKNFINFMA